MMARGWRVQMIDRDSCGACGRIQRGCCESLPPGVLQKASVDMVVVLERTLSNHSDGGC